VIARAVNLPDINHSALPNGLTIWHIQSRSLPVVQLRLVVRAGSSLDRDRPGLARMTALVIARSFNAPPAGPPANTPRPDSLVPEVQVDPGTTVFALDLPKDHFEEGVDRLGAIARQPKLDSTPLGDLRNHEQQRASEMVRDDPASVARAIATRDLLGLSQPPTPQDLSKITTADCKAFHKAAYAPKNLGLVVVGDVTFDEAVQAGRRALGTLDAATISAQPPAPPAAVQYTRVIVADRPSSADSVMLLAMPGPAPTDSLWPALWLAREHAAAAARSCPPPSAATLLSLDAGSGPVPMSVCLTAPTGQTADRVASALDRMRRGAGDAMSAVDLDAARASFNETFATRLSSLQALADFAAFAMGAGMQHDQVGRQAAQLQTTTAEQVRDVVRARARDGILVVVVGDASKLGDELSRFGDVTIVDPSEGFARKRQIPASPGTASSKP
jgi:zinc protease